MTESRAEPTRVLLCTDWWDTTNGVVASVATLKRELARAGCDVRLLTLATGRRSGREADMYRIGSIPASILYESARIGSPRHHAIERDILRWSPQVVHSHSEFTTYMWARRLAGRLGVPWVHSYHTIYEDYTHYYSPSLSVGKKVAAAFSRRTLNRTDAVITPTSKVLELLTGYGVTTPIEVVPTGLDLDRFRPARTPSEQADAQQLRRRHGIPADHRVLLSVSRLAKEKNLEEVLDHYAASHVEATTLVLVGDGPHRSALEQHVAQLRIGDRVRFVGRVEHAEVARYYRMGDVFVSASLSETQGLSYIEALACGLPLLVRRDPCLAGVAIDDVTGWQFDDTAGFEEGLARTLERHTLERLSRSATAHAEHFAAASFGRAVNDVYQAARRNHAHHRRSA